MHSAYGTRLLSIGEIFDRAVHLTISNLLPLASIVGLVAVPVRAIADWLDRDELSRYFGTVGKMVADPKLFANYFTLVQGPHSHNPWTMLLWILATLLPLSLAIAAASIALQEYLNGERPKLGAAYRSAIRRLGPIIGASMLTLATLAAGFTALIIVVCSSGSCGSSSSRLAEQRSPEHKCLYSSGCSFPCFSWSPRG